MPRHWRSTGSQRLRSQGAEVELDSGISSAGLSAQGLARYSVDQAIQSLASSILAARPTSFTTRRSLDVHSADRFLQEEVIALQKQVLALTVRSSSQVRLALSLSLIRGASPTLPSMLPPPSMPGVRHRMLLPASSWPLTSVTGSSAKSCPISLTGG